jgi:hypothetical protein
MRVEFSPAQTGRIKRLERPDDEGDMKRAGPLGVVLLFLLWFPLVAIGVLAGIALGWRVPAAFAAYLGSFVAMIKIYSPDTGKARSAAEFVGFALAGGVVGGLLFGVAGAIIGVVFGLTMRLGPALPRQAGRPRPSRASDRARTPGRPNRRNA